MREKHIEIVRECEVESRLEQQGCKPSAIVKGHRIEISGQQKFVSKFVLFRLYISIDWDYIFVSC